MEMQSSEALAAPAGERAAGQWRLSLPVLLALVAWVLFWYRDTLTGMVDIWAKSETFAHGFVVLPIALWLVWQRRQQLAPQIPRPSAWLLVPLAAAGFAWLLGDLAAVNAVAQTAMVGVLALTIMAVLGLHLSRAVAFPLAFLFFAVPIGEFVMPQLMEWTADFAILGLQLSGVPVYREGLHFVIPSGSWSVVEACSGVRYLIASLMVGTLFAYLNYASTQKRLIFVAVSAIVPIVANWIRAYMIVMLGHLSNNRLAAGVDHLIYGWVFFGVVMVIMFFIGSRWSEAIPPLPPPGVAETEATGPSYRLALVAAAVALVTALPPLLPGLLAGDRAPAPVQLSLPASLGAASPWTLAAEGVPRLRPAFDEASAVANGEYQRDGQSVGLFVAYYRDQGPGRQLVTSSNALVKTSDPAWGQVTGGSRDIRLGGATVTARRAVLRGKLESLPADGKLDVLYWYWINGRLTASDHLAKAYLALDRLLGRPDDSAVIVLSTGHDQAGGGAARLDAFADETAEALGAVLAAARDRR